MNEVKVLEMDKQAISNLYEIVKLGYPHICLNIHDFKQFTNIPARDREFYRIRRGGSKQGFFNNGRTCCWADWGQEMGHIKISIANPVDLTKGWTDPMPFEQKDSPLQIYRFMKLKAFW